MDYPGTTARYYRVIGNTGNAAVKEPCYNVLKCLGILTATYKHAQDAFSTNKTLPEFCHLKLTTKIINLQTKTLCSIRQKWNFGNRFDNFQSIIGPYSFIFKLLLQPGIRGPPFSKFCCFWSGPRFGKFSRTWSWSLSELVLDFLNCFSVHGSLVVTNSEL